MNATTAFHRPLGRSEIQVSALGLGCWAIGGPFYDADGKPLAGGRWTDNESIRAIPTAPWIGA